MPSVPFVGASGVSKESEKFMTYDKNKKELKVGDIVLGWDCYYFTHENCIMEVTELFGDYDSDMHNLKVKIIGYVGKIHESRKGSLWDVDSVKLTKLEPICEDKENSYYKIRNNYFRISKDSQVTSMVDKVRKSRNILNEID